MTEFRDTAPFMCYSKEKEFSIDMVQEIHSTVSLSSASLTWTGIFAAHYFSPRCLLWDPMTYCLGAWGLHYMYHRQQFSTNECPRISMLLQQCIILTACSSSSLCVYVYLKVLYESTSEESADEDGEQESEEGLLDMEDLGPMMNKMRKTKVKYHWTVI